MLNEDTLKSALLGAAIGAGASLLFKRSLSEWAMIGGGVGLASDLVFKKPLGSFLVGALPAGSDYSFTRQPGFNDKNY
jgi:hypothetical protein